MTREIVKFIGWDENGRAKYETICYEICFDTSKLQASCEQVKGGEEK